MGDTFEALAIRQEWEMVYDDGILLEAPLKSTSCSMVSRISSTLLETIELEETQVFVSWQQDKASISL